MKTDSQTYLASMSWVFHKNKQIKKPNISRVTKFYELAKMGFGCYFLSLGDVKWLQVLVST